MKKEINHSSVLEILEIEVIVYELCGMKCLFALQTIGHSVLHSNVKDADTDADTDTKSSRWKFNNLDR